MGSFWPKYMFELRKCRRVMFHGTEDWCKIWRKIDLCFPKWYEESGKLKNSNFILESKMAELNQNKNSKQLDWPDAVTKLYFPEKLTKLFTYVLENHCS